MVCANGALRERASVQANAAVRAQSSGDWHVALRNWARAVKNGEDGKLDDKTQAAYYYEYGRALGVTCSFDEAESYLLKAKDLDEKTTGEEFLSLSELARLNLDQKKYKQAVLYFEEAFPKLDKLHAAYRSPIAYADLLDEYSIALSMLNRNDESKRASNRASELRKKKKNGFSMTERTPYGSRCSK